MEEPQNQAPLPAAAPLEKQAAALPKKRAAKARKKTSVKSEKPAALSRFDYDLLRCIAKGTSNQLELLNTLLVDPSEFAARVKNLANKKLIVRDAVDANVLRLGIKGYNYLQEAEEKKLKKNARQSTNATIQNPALETQGSNPETPSPAPNVAENTLTQKQEAGNANDATSIPAPSTTLTPESPRSAMEEKPIASPEIGAPLGEDLSEIIKKYGPNANQTQNTRAVRQQPVASQRMPMRPQLSRPALPQTPQQFAQPAHSAEENCDLCKAGFKNSVSAVENFPKYGHCFCGAAYHKDCFEGIIEGDGKCVRCGKRLRLSLDRKSEDAVKGIKNAF